MEFLRLPLSRVNCHLRRSPIAAVLLLLLFQLPAPGRAGDQPTTKETQPKPGWLDKPPPDAVKLYSGRRNPIFYVGEPVVFQLRGGWPVHYEVRDYWGGIVDQGATDVSLQLRVKQPGWYKLYVYAADPPPANIPPAVLEYRHLYGNSVGGTTFVILRPNPHFPQLPARAPNGTSPPEDEPLRGVGGIGPQRLFVQDAAKPQEEIRRLDQDVALDKRFYLPFDPERHRALLIAFSNGTKDKLEGVRRIVTHFQNDVRYWEARNEPNFGASGRDFVEKELKPFYQTIKSVDPSLKVIGPGTVTIGPQLQPWLEDFFQAGGGNDIDAFSFHFYNGLNGDLWLGRKSLDTLEATLDRYRLQGIEKWQTEQGYFACVYGSYQPRLQGRWTMLEMMLFEQYAIPKEHNVLWYDRSHGFWDVPTWWENDDGSVNPAFPLMRVWAEELYGKHFAHRIEFGPAGENLFIGSLFEGRTGTPRVAAFASAGATDLPVPLKVSGTSTLHLVSAFGVETDLPAPAGHAMLPVPEIPVYVELAPGQRIDVEPQDWGTNLAREPGVLVTASGSGRHPVDPKLPNDIAKLTNGELENWYWLQQPTALPWMDDTPAFPAWVQLHWPQSRTISRVVIFAAIPWQWGGTLQDYELQYARGDRWITIDHVIEPLNTFCVVTPSTRTKIDSFFGDRCIFVHHFAPLKTDSIRLLVHNTTWGGGATEDLTHAGGQTGPHHINLREIEATRDELARKCLLSFSA